MLIVSLGASESDGFTVNILELTGFEPFPVLLSAIPPATFIYFPEPVPFMLDNVKVLTFPVPEKVFLAVNPTKATELSRRLISATSPEKVNLKDTLPPSSTTLELGPLSCKAHTVAFIVFTGIDTKAIAAIATIANTFLNLIFFIIIFSSIYYYNFILAHFT